MRSDIAPMSVATASMRIDIAPSSIDIALLSIPFTRCECTSPRCQLTSARCSRPSSVCRLAFVLRLWHLRAGARRTAAATGNWCSLPFTLTRRLVVSQFPRTEAEIAALALVVIQGLEQAADDFPNPPVPAAELRAKLEAFNTANTGAIAADTAAEGQHAVKDDALADLAP